MLKQGTEVATVKVPARGASVDGTCNGTDGTQSITLSWGEEGETSSTTMTFTHSKDNWSLSSFTASLYMDNKTFPNTDHLGELIFLLSGDESAFVGLYKCRNILDVMVTF